MIPKSTVANLRTIKIVELVLLSLFIISLFIPYVWGVKPKEYFWDIWTNSIDVWPWFFIIGLPLVLSFFLFVLISATHAIRKPTLNLLTWLITGVYMFIVVLHLLETVKIIINPDSFFGGFLVIYIIALVFSLFLFVLTIIKSKDDYFKIENFIISIIAIPVVSHCILITVFEFGGYLLNISFAALYLLAVLKVFMFNKMEETGIPKN